MHPWRTTCCVSCALALLSSVGVVSHPWTTCTAFDVDYLFSLMPPSAPYRLYLSPPLAALGLERVSTSVSCSGRIVKGRIHTHKKLLQTLYRTASWLPSVRYYVAVSSLVAGWALGPAYVAHFHRGGARLALGPSFARTPPANFFQ